MRANYSYDWLTTVTGGQGDHRPRAESRVGGSLDQRERSWALWADPETLGRRGEQSAKKLLTDMMGDFSEDWVIYQVEAELAALGYMRTQATPWWRPTPEVQRFVGDCEQLRTLEQECAQAVDRWRRVILADQQLCDALLADCTTPSPHHRQGSSESGGSLVLPDHAATFCSVWDRLPLRPLQDGGVR
jgi:hypothetical protein